MVVRREAAVVTTGAARVDRRTKDLIRRLHPGDVAVIDHEDIDRIAAEGLIERRAGAVVNAARSMSGRYPNVGPLLLAAAGIPLVDDVGGQVLDVISEGQQVRIEGGQLAVGGAVVARGQRQSMESLEQAYQAARLSMGGELERFAENTLEYLRREHHLLTDPLPMPDLEVDLRGRHALIVVRGFDYKNDLAHLRSYIREIRPVLVAVDGGADALLEFGFKPHVIIGDFDSVSTVALRGGAELIVHAYPGGEAPGSARLDDLGLKYKVLAAPGTSEDVAMLLVDDKGADLIVAVGAHASMVEFLDKGRSGMASTFLVRLKLGEKLVDAKGVSKLYEGRVRKRDLAYFLMAAMLCFMVVYFTIVPAIYRSSVSFLLGRFWHSVTS